MKKEVGIIGMGKMGSAMAKLLIQKGYRVIVYNRSPEKTQFLGKDGATLTFTIEEFVNSFKASKKVVILMLKAGLPVDEILFGDNSLCKYLTKEDYVLDCGNSYYKDDFLRNEKLNEIGINFVDVGFSGGPEGARNGACLMVGGTKKQFEYLKTLFFDLALKDGVSFFEGVGAGHYAKMIHNGIEYGMMQAIAEGFNLLKKSGYQYNLEEVARVYNNGSVIESRLIGWLQKAFNQWGADLKEISGTINHSGEGKWTVEEAEEKKEDLPVIKEAYNYRVESVKKPNYIGKVVSALRGQFGGHEVKK